MTITLAQLQEIMPNSGEKSEYYFPYIKKAMSSGGINNCARIAAFLAQIGHESGSLIYTTEIADGSGYEGITDIGNTSPGDGVRYKGRGVIQVTGKYNYQIVGDALGYDFVSDPEKLATTPYCVDSAVWWWNNHTLSPIADANTQESFDQTTRIINGGYNGKADRDSRWAVAKRVLGC
jgi:predicted chitinase